MNIRTLLVAAAAASLTLVPYARAQQIVYAQQLPPVTLRGLPAADPNVRPREILQQPHWPRLTPRTFSTATLPPLERATIAPPPVVLGFTSATTRNVSPADAAGAVGKSHIVTATNAGLTVHKRTGEILGSAGLGPFFQFNNAANAEVYDPRIVYDRDADRWIVIALRNAESFLIAVSRSGDPMGTWNRYSLSFTFSVEIDFTHLALTRDTVMFATNGESETVLFSVRKSDLFAGPSSLPISRFHYEEYDTLPVRADDSAAEYVVVAESDGIDVARIDGTNRHFISNPYPSDRFARIAPQLGTTSGLETGAERYPIESAVLRNGVLYAVQTVGDWELDRSAILWWKVNPESGKLLASGVIASPDPTKYYAYPSVAVNGSGAMLIGFCTFSPSQYASAGYVFRDAAGRISSEGALRNGESTFTITTRWGDYTTTVIDPFDDNTFWTLQIFARGQQWSTVWGEVQAPITPVRRRSVRH
ncbi:MAG TPA: hypothetical protein VF824_02040 [Thermoanaerobaculia bacterium]